MDSRTLHCDHLLCVCVWVYCQLLSFIRFRVHCYEKKPTKMNTTTHDDVLFTSIHTIRKLTQHITIHFQKAKQWCTQNKKLNNKWSFLLDYFIRWFFVRVLFFCNLQILSTNTKVAWEMEVNALERSRGRVNFSQTSECVQTCVDIVDFSHFYSLQLMLHRISCFRITI